MSGGGASVLLADEHLLAVDKPAGRLVIPGRGTDERSLREELEATHGRLWVVHRLDRGTSGVLLFARTAAAHRTLNLAFDRGEPAKRYLALVRGTPPAESRVDLAVAPARRGRMRPARPGDPRGKPSATRLRLLEAFPPRPWAGGALSLVEASPETGRTHQIRVHLGSIGHPCVADEVYGQGKTIYLKDLAGEGAVDPRVPDPSKPILARQALHAFRIELRHPGTGEPVAFEAPLAADMHLMVDLLREYRAV